MAPDPKRSPVSSTHTAKASLGLSNGFLFDCVLLLVHWAPSDLTQVQDILYLKFFYIANWYDIRVPYNFVWISKIQPQIPAADRELWQKLFIRLMHAVLRDHPAESRTSVIRPQLELLQLFAASYRDILRVPFGYCTVYCIILLVYSVQFMDLVAHIAILSSQFSDLVKALNLKDEAVRIERVLLLARVLLKQKLELDAQQDSISQWALCTLIKCSLSLQLLQQLLQ